MAFNVTLFNLSKKENSTERPSNGTSFNCVLKSPSGIINPILEFDVGLSNVPNYNYCYIPSFNRYYWIEEWTNRGALWIASLKVDVLATYKDAIGDSNLYILRSASQWDGNVVDAFYPFKADIQTTTQTSNVVWANGFASGTFALQVSGNTTNEIIGMNLTQLNTLVTALSNDYVTTGNGFSDLDASMSLQLGLIDPFQYITSCVWLPVPYSQFPSGATRTGLTIGGLTLDNVTYKLLPSSFPIETVTAFAIPRHPQSSSRGNYLNGVGTQHRLYIPPFGMINLDSNLAMKFNYVMARYDLDCITGNGNCLVGYTNGATTYGNMQLLEQVIPSKLGVNVQLSHVFKTPFENVLTASGSGWDAISKVFDGFISGSFASTVGGILSAMGHGKLDIKGSPEGFVYLLDKPRLETEFMIAVDDDVAMCGRPLCQIKKAKDLGGYMVVQDGDIKVNATSLELEQIRNYLETGFYYE